MASLTSVLIKSQFKSKFKFDELYSVEFTADKLRDQLILSGIGLIKGERIKRTQPELKLSEHKSEEKLFMNYLGKIEAKEIHRTITFIDFENENIKSDIYFINLNDTPTKRTVSNKI